MVAIMETSSTQRQSRLPLASKSTTTRPSTPGGGAVGLVGVHHAGSCRATGSGIASNVRIFASPERGFVESVGTSAMEAVTRFASLNP